MEIENCVALVTGANRGLGKAYVQALLDAGCAKVYAGTRGAEAIDDPRVTPLQLDVTSVEDVNAAAARCTDVTLLINNAGIMTNSPVMSPGSEDALVQEMDVNVLGLIRLTRAFAPVLVANGGGTIANMLSVVSWFTAPGVATYSASKHAALAITESCRVELKGKGIHVLSVHAGFIDTDMAARVTLPKTSPRQVAERTLDGVRRGASVVRADDRAEQTWATTFNDPASIESIQQSLWDQAQAGEKP